MKIGDKVRIIDGGLKTATYPNGIQEFLLGKKGEIINKFNGMKAAPGYHLVLYKLEKAGVPKDYITMKKEEQLELLKK
jgi:hypothetical protein